MRFFSSISVINIVRSKRILLKMRIKTDGAVAPKTASALWQGFMLCMESLPYFYEKSVEPMAWIADDLRFATQLSNVYGNAIRAKLAAAQTTRSVAGSFSSFVTQNLQCICSLYHRHPRFFHKSSESDSIANSWFPAIYATPEVKSCFCPCRMWHNKKTLAKVNRFCWKCAQKVRRQLRSLDRYCDGPF